MLPTDVPTSADISSTLFRRSVSTICTQAQCFHPPAGRIAADTRPAVKNIFMPPVNPCFLHSR
jgi:hypothetical protein